MTEPALTLPLETARLRVREFRADDAWAVHLYAADPEVVRFMHWGPNTWDETGEALARMAAHAAESPRAEFGLAMALIQTDQAVGSIALHLAGRPEGTAEIGYCLRRDLWGQGLVAEAARALVAAAFAQLGLRRVFATCDARNQGSWKVMEKLGMVREGLLRQERQTKGEWRDTLVYGLLREEWEGRAS